MPELLLELFSEEIPARMQLGAAEQLRTKAEEALKANGFKFDKLQTYVTPRRLVLVADGIPAKQEDVSIEHKGPRTDAAPAALEGFLKKTGLKIEQLEKRATDKGECYFAKIEQKGKETASVLPTLLAEIITNFHWPKSMRWGAGTFRWVRPLKNICCLFDGKILPLTVAHLASNNKSYGHRFLSSAAFDVKSFAEYKDELQKRFVILDSADRAKAITEQAEKLVSAKGLKLHPDDKLLEEVSGLTEWPIALLGNIEERFLKLPQEVLMTSMRSHQKYFSVVDAKGKIAPHYIVVTNMKTDDNGKRILDGNGRVLRARLSDAEFFYAQDKKQPLESYLAGLSGMVFHAKLGTMAERVERITSLSKQIATHLNIDPKKAERAARLAKADLSTQMVGEFPELQGIMGAYYTSEDKETADAIRDHYKPLGPSDDCPKASLSFVIALADKTDTLAGMFAVGETPTGSKDPFALRRAALGIIRLILENELSLPLKTLFADALKQYNLKKDDAKTVGELLTFFEDRLKATLKAQGTRHDLVSAVFAKGEDNLLQITRRVDALAGFVTSDNGKNLLAAYKRAANILGIEEKKDKKTYSGEPSTQIAEQEEEKTLLAALEGLKKPLAEALKTQDYQGAMKQLSNLRAPVDAFFDKVKVNVDNAPLRENRLKILANLREQCDAIAKFSLIEG
jgi:glycyl-tRNA synthetase beta chain